MHVCASAGGTKGHLMLAAPCFLVAPIWLHNSWGLGSARVLLANTQHQPHQHGREPPQAVPSKPPREHSHRSASARPHCRLVVCLCVCVCLCVYVCVCVCLCVGVKVKPIRRSCSWAATPLPSPLQLARHGLVCLCVCVFPLSSRQHEGGHRQPGRCCATASAAAASMQLPHSRMAL